MKLSNKPFLIDGTIHRDRLCLLLHGLGGGVYEMQPLAEYLQSLGYSTCGILYPGHDQASQKMPSSTWEEWYFHAEQTYQTLAAEYSTIDLIGFSTGCLLALKLALNYSINAMVLMAPYFLIRRRWYFLLPPEAYLYSLGYLIPNVPRLSLPIRDRAMRKAAEEAAFFQTFNLPAVRSTIDLIQRLKPQLNQITIPTRIVQSKADTVVDPSGAEYLYDQLASSQKDLQWLKTSDHIIPLDQERTMVFQGIKDFLGVCQV